MIRVFTSNIGIDCGFCPKVLLETPRNLAQQKVAGIEHPERSHLETQCELRILSIAKEGV